MDKMKMMTKMSHSSVADKPTKLISNNARLLLHNFEID